MSQFLFQVEMLYLLALGIATAVGLSIYYFLQYTDARAAMRNEAERQWNESGK